MARRDFYNSYVWRNSVRSPYDPDYDDRYGNVDDICDAYENHLEDMADERRYDDD